MIIFVPAYDEATRANLTIAKLIVTPTSVNLFQENATRDALLKALSENNEPLFIMSHGDPNILYAQNGEVALSNEDGHMLGKRSIYAFACHTAVPQLGKAVADGGNIWWGYSSWISCAIDSPSVRRYFTEIFIFIRDNFHTATSYQQRQQMLHQLKQICAIAQDEINYLYSETETPDFEILAVNLTLLHLWDRLRIWTPGATIPEKHPSASSDVTSWW